MSPHSPDSANKILQYTAVAAKALQDVALTAQIPFLNTVCALSLTIIAIVEITKFQKDQCFRMVEEIHQLLCVLMGLCVHSEDIRSPRMLDKISHYALTLQKFHSCLRAQRDLGTLKRLFKQSEITAQLDICERELKAASEIFQLQYGVGIASALLELSIDTETRHQELVELISLQSTSDNTSSMGRSSFNTSSGSLSLLPALPKIFHGRDPELNDLVGTMLGDFPRAVILGPGGMGKTTLATATLHHPEITAKYTAKHFISCESAHTFLELVSNVGLTLGLQPSGQLSKAIVRHLGQCGPCLVVLDNFETPWEPAESRGQVEEFISLLADIPSLALLVTMRGAERPGKVKWNRPFLPPLEPLAPSDSRLMLVEVADEPTPGEESVLNDLLDRSGHLPLAVSLMANIISFEGYSKTLSRWDAENTALLSDGHDKRSNLEKSITLSLGSPRIASSPHAINLLALLSLLPDGIRADDIIAGGVPIPDVRQWQSVLLRTSLAYMDVKGLLKVLSPIREYIRRIHPPSLTLTRPLRIYFQDLLQLWKSRNLQLPSGNLAPLLVTHLGNINELMLNGLAIEEKTASVEMVDSIITLDHFSGVMLKGHSPLAPRLPHLIQATGDAGLRWRYASTCLANPGHYRRIQDPDVLIEEGVRYFEAGTHSTREGDSSSAMDSWLADEGNPVVTFYNSAGRYYEDLNKSTKFNKIASELARQADDVDLQLLCLDTEIALTAESGDPYLVLEVTHRAREIGKFSPPFRAFGWIKFEAWATRQIGNLSRALALCAEADELLKSIGMENADKHLGILDLRADVLMERGEYLEARQLHEQILNKTSPTSSPWYHANALCNLAYVDILLGRQGTEITANIKAVKAVYSGLGTQRILACSWLDAELQLYCAETDSARASFIECLSKSRGIYSDITQLCLAAMGDLKNRMHGPWETFSWAVVYLAFMQKNKDPVGTLNALRRLADAYPVLDDEDTMLDLFRAALQGGTTLGMIRLRAECMVGIGDIMLHRGDLLQAKQMWAGAQPLLVRSSLMKDVAGVEERLEKISHDERNPSHALRNDNDE